MNYSKPRTNGYYMGSHVIKPFLVASGTFTQANARLSLVDGTAFFDCGADLSAYAGLDSGSHEYLIKVYDDDGYSIQGYVGAVGGGEALAAASNVSDCVNSSYNTFDGVSPTAFRAVGNDASNSRGGTADEIVMVAGELWKSTFTRTTNSGVNPIVQFRKNFGGTQICVGMNVSTADGTNTKYREEVRRIGQVNTRVLIIMIVVVTAIRSIR